MRADIRANADLLLDRLGYVGRGAAAAEGRRMRSRWRYAAQARVRWKHMSDWMR